jgi:hypothetical protein
MKTAILLVGVSYHPGYLNIEEKIRSVDFLNTSNNMKSGLIDGYPDSDVYISTYHSIRDKELENFYSPKHIIYNDWETGYNESTIISGINGLQTYADLNNIHYDIIIISRMDLIFYSNVNTWNFDYFKINFLFREGNFEPCIQQGRSCNVLWLFPYSYINIFKDSLLEADKHKSTGIYDGVPSHWFSSFIKDRELIHYVLSDYSCSTGLSGYYKVIHYPDPPGM